MVLGEISPSEAIITAYPDAMSERNLSRLPVWSCSSTGRPLFCNCANASRTRGIFFNFKTLCEIELIRLRKNISLPRCAKDDGIRMTEQKTYEAENDSLFQI